MRKHCGIMILLLMVFHSGISQVNLVINSSLELDTCPEAWGGGGTAHYVPSWDTFRNGGGGTPDLFNECYNHISNNNYSTPSHHSGGFQYPKSGGGYLGLCSNLNPVTSPTIREYIQGELTQKLVQGNVYCVKIYVNLSNFSQYSCLSLGAYLDDGQVYSVGHQIPEPYITPQIVNTEQQLDDTLNWIKIEGSFIANGTEEYINIGNFMPIELSGIVHSYPSNPSNGAYYYIDDVSVIDMSTPAQAGNDTIIHPGESVFIGRQPEIGLNEACIWFVDGVPIDTIAGMWVTPEETTTYVLQQTLCGDIKYDTVTVVVDEFAGVFELQQAGHQVLVYPNPAHKELHIHVKNSGASIREISIYTMTGKEHYRESFSSSAATKTIPLAEKLNVGLYVVEITLSNGTTERVKFVKQ